MRHPRRFNTVPNPGNPLKKQRPKRAKQGAVRPGTAQRTGSAPRPRRAWRLDRWLLAIVALAALLRLWGIADRLPEPSIGINVLDDTAVEETDRTTIGRAWTMWAGGTKRLDLNPHTGGWPALSFYLTLLIQLLYKAGWALGNAAGDAMMFARHVEMESRNLFLIARVINLALGVVTVLLTFRLGRLLAGRTVGLAAALLMAFNALHILASQHVMDPNLLSLFFLLLAAIPMARIASGEGRPRDSILAGAMGLPAVVAIAALAWPMPELARMRDSLRLPDSRHVSRRWIQQNILPSDPQMIELYGPVFREDERNFIIWPFFATQAPLVSPAYHPEFLDGIKYAVLSREIRRRYEADSTLYPREFAFYRWLRTKTRLVWTTEDMKLAGPVIEVRALPPSTSTAAMRDSVFRAAMPQPTHTTRLALWCAQMAGVFGRMDLDDRSEEWAQRGISVGARNMMPQLYAALALARLRLKKFPEAEMAAAKGIELAPKSYSLYLYRAMALEELGRPEESLESLRRAFAMSNDLRIQLNIGELLADMGRYPEAAEALALVPRGSPQRAQAQRDLAVIFLNRMGRREEGIAALREAADLQTDPDQAKLLRDELDRLSRGAPPAAPAR